MPSRHNGSNDTTTFIIDKANAVLTVAPYSVTYDANSHTATGTATGVLGEPLAGLDLSGTTHTNAGSYADSWTFTDTTGNYNNASGAACIHGLNPATASPPRTMRKSQAATACPGQRAINGTWTPTYQCC